jgi:hypothetical protein
MEETKKSLPQLYSDLPLPNLTPSAGQQAKYAKLEVASYR